MASSKGPAALSIVEGSVEPLLDALLGAGGQMMIPLRGSSMHPTLLDGDRVIVAPFLGLPQAGQIAVGRRDERLLVHRLVAVEMVDGRRRYILQGDAPRCSDAGFLREDLLGRVVAVIRQGRRIEIDDSPAVLRRELLRSRLRRRASRTLRGAAVLVMAALCTLGCTGISQECIDAPARDCRFGPQDAPSLRIWNGERRIACFARARWHGGLYEETLHARTAA